MGTRALRASSYRYPPEVRRRARELYLRGLSIRKTAALLTDELKGTEGHTGDQEVSHAIVAYWAKRGQWEIARKQALRLAERKQLRRVQQELAGWVEREKNNLTFLEDWIRKQYYKPAQDGQPPEMRSPDEEGSPVDLADLTDMFMRLIDRQHKFAELVANFMGDVKPKVRAPDLNLTTEGGDADEA